MQSIPDFFKFNKGKLSTINRMDIHPYVQFLIIVLLTIGIFFRFANIDKKVYWEDEVFTSLRASAYTWNEFVKQELNGQVIGIEDLQKYQRYNLERSAIDTVKSLADEDSLHPPLYYVIARFWQRLFGSSVAAIRSLSALFSLLAFPAIYWLCLELFESPLVGSVAMALIAVSPFCVLYAQEAREYSLWAVTTLVSSAVLLRSIRLNTKLNWTMYAATVAIGLYVHTFTMFALIGHAIYIAVIEKFRLSKILIAYLLASLLGIVAFLPWLITIIINLPRAQSMMTYTVQKLPPISLIWIWIGNVSRLFIDFGFDDFGSQNLFTKGWPLIFISLMILALVGYGIYFLCRHTSPRVWLFICITFGVPALALVLPDLILGGRRSTVMRYITPFYLGIQLVVAFLLTYKITSFPGKMWQVKGWKILAIALISCGVISCGISSQSSAWWNKGTGLIYLKIAPIINQADRPLLISDSNELVAAREVALSYLLAPKVKLLLTVEPNTPKIKIPDGFSDVFVYDPSKALQVQIEQLTNRKLEPIYKGNSKIWLWRITDV